MYLLGKRIDQITPEDIGRLIEGQIRENISLEYKMDFQLASDSEKKEFLYDITSMMNAEGGCFVFGLKEKKDEKGENTGTPEEITGVNIDNEDKFKQKIEDMIKTCTDPQRSNIQIKFIEIEEKKVSIIGISKGLGFPTMVTFKDSNKFYKRRNTGKFLVDVHELNQMFMQNDTFLENITHFLVKRIENVRQGKAYPNIDARNSYFIHIFPFNYKSRDVLDLSRADTMNLDEFMKPMNASSWDRMFNAYGYTVYSQSGPDYKLYAYDQLLRKGIYEAYTATIFEEYDISGGRGTIYRMEGKEFIKTTLNKIKNGLYVLKKFEIEPPFIICFSLHGIKGGVIKDGYTWTLRKFLDNEIMFSPQVLQTFEADIYKLLKPNFDILWQCLGVAKSPDIEI